MAYHFSANQFEEQYKAKKLGNWEYPKWYPERPRQRTKSTKIIAQDNGHLLEGVKKENPWGNYLGTWDLPRRITRDFAEKLAAPPERFTSRWLKKKESISSEKKLKENADDQLITEEEPEPCLKEECNENEPTTTSSDDIMSRGEPLTCTKCENAICICFNPDI